MIYSVFAKKYVKWNSFAKYKVVPDSSISSSRLIYTEKPTLKLDCVSYKCHTPKLTQSIQSEELKYDIFSTTVESNYSSFAGNAYIGADGYAKLSAAENLVLSYGDGKMTIGFLT